MAARGGLSIQWQGNSLQRLKQRMNMFGFAVRNSPQKSFEYWAPIIEQAAKDAAKWSDRSGDARRGIRAGVENNGDGVELYLTHTVKYGIWLEIRWQGKFAVIGPTLLKYQDQIMEDLGRQVFLQLPG